MWYADYLHILDETGQEVTELALDNSVTEIPYKAFHNCDRLTTVTIPGSVQTIGERAFYSCASLTTVTIPDSVQTIGDSAFHSCTSLTTVTIPDSVQTIGNDAFGWCSGLTTVAMGDSVQTIGNYAFEHCDSLTDVYYAGTQTQWKAIGIGSDNSYLTSATIHYSHIHDYSLFPPVTVAATCTSDGYVKYTCIFGETYREILPKLPHDYTGKTTVAAPTCTEDGYTTILCTNCGVPGEKFDIVPSLGGHQMIVLPAVAPTCTEPGLTVGTACEHCGLVGIAQKEVPALGHDFTGAETVVAPTCTEEGYTAVLCSKCNVPKEKHDIVSPLGHEMIVLPAVAPTCTEPGLTAGSACQRCQLAGIAQKEVPALGHSFADGVCTVCGAPDAIPGDLDGVEGISEDDAIYLLQHVLMPEFFPVEQAVDFDGNGEITEDDAIYLLQHVLMPDLFPL